MFTVNIKPFLLGLALSSAAFFLLFACDYFARNTLNSALTTAPQIVMDKQRNIIRFIINGQEVAEINQTGLAVKGIISYSGQLIDTGPAPGQE